MTTDAPDNPPSRKRAWKDFGRFLLVGLFFVCVALLLKNPYVRGQVFDIETIRNQFQGGGLRGNLIFIAAASLINALGIPRMWICAVAGSLFGAVEGGIVGLIATLLGSSLNFLAGRSLLQGPLRRNIPRRLRHWYTAFNNHGFRAILYLRLFPFTNATLTNLMGGASRMRYRDYLAATAIGYLPFTIAFATLGSSAAKQNGLQLALGLVVFAAVALGQWWWSYRRKKRHLAALAHAGDMQPMDSQLRKEADI